MNIISEFRGEHFFLSNHYPCSVTYGDDVFPSAEHAFSAAKTSNRLDIDRILSASSPGEAKRIGRSVELIDDWARVKFRKMKVILRSKFDSESNPELSKMLLHTFPSILVEGNTWHDMIWGSCSCPRHRDIQGNNALGHLLMEIRFRLYTSSIDR